MIVLLLVVLLIAGGSGYYGHNRWGPGGGAGISLGSILVILLVAYLLGLLPR